MTETSKARFLVLDGIGGVPLGREIADSLAGYGHEAVHFDCLKQKRRAFYEIRSAYAKTVNKRAEKDGFCFLPRLGEETLHKLADETRPTHILVVGFIYKFFDPRQLKRLAKAYGASLWLYDTDSCNLYDKRREFIFFIEEELPVYDRIYSFSQVTTRFFTETRGLPAVHLPFGAQPVAVDWNTEKTIDALFVGSGDFRRILQLEAVRDKVTVFGNRWQRNYPLISGGLRTRITDRPVWGDELQRLLARAKIVLNITRTDFWGAETGVNLRIFEAVAAGCFLLTDHCDEIGDLFEIGKEIDTFHSSRELADKVRFYLENDGEREAIARRGHERFVKCHTWQTRVQQMLS
jgi:spore maturation protein CgeB